METIKSATIQGMKALHKLNKSAGKRLVIALIVGIIIALVLKTLAVGNISFLLGWDAAVVIFVIWVLAIILPMDHKQTAEFALREDPTRAGADIALISAAIASLGAVVFALVQASHSTGTHQLLLTVVGIGSVVLAWILIHTIYTLRYAVLYYSPDVVGSIDFKHDHVPEYTDFAYLAFTIGMTYQVADTDLIGSAFRKTVLRHSILSYVFGTVIIATTVSLIAGLGH